MRPFLLFWNWTFNNLFQESWKKSTFRVQTFPFTFPVKTFEFYTKIYILLRLIKFFYHRGENNSDFLTIVSVYWCLFAKKKFYSKSCNNVKMGIWF